jgi:hypothetical protein
MSNGLLGRRPSCMCMAPTPPVPQAPICLGRLNKAQLITGLAGSRGDRGARRGSLLFRIASYWWLQL